VVSGRVYVATDVGVFTSAPRSIRWHVLGRGLPNVSATHLRYVASNGSLYVSTFGRCVWSIPLS
jgi:hypothetical protein